MTDINKLVEIGLKALNVKTSNEFSAARILQIL